MKRYEIMGATLLALGGAWTQAGAPLPGDAGAATAPIALDGAPQDATLTNPAAPDATGFDAATFQRVAEHQMRLGTFSEGLGQVATWAEEGDYPAARLLGQQLLAPDLLSSWRAQLELDGSRVVGPALDGADPLIDWLGLGERTRGERASVRYALGVIDLAEELPERATAEFTATRAAARGAGLRGDAIYNLGTLALQEGELWRSQIPELGGQPPTPQPPAQPGGPPAPGADEEPPDPLEQARAYYLRAKDHFVERLRLDASHADTRANTELVFRRLRELDEIERQREEQEQEQEQNSDEQEDEPDEQDPEDQDPQDQQQDPEDQEPQDPSDGEPEGEPEPQKEEPEPEEPQEGEAEEGEPDESDAQPPQPRDEQYLTKEEVQRLLERLEEHEELGKQLLERKRQAQQRSSARDW